MLIDMVNDPGEMKNLAVDPEYEEVVAEHRAMISRHVRERGDRLFSPY
jgi:hypothetical protein